MEESVYRIIEREARNGDGHFAIAFAILRLSDVLGHLGESPEGYSFGALTNLANEIKRLADQAERATDSLSR